MVARPLLVTRPGSLAVVGEREHAIIIEGEEVEIAVSLLF